MADRTFHICNRLHVPIFIIVNPTSRQLTVEIVPYPQQDVGDDNEDAAGFSKPIRDVEVAGHVFVIAPDGRARLELQDHELDDWDGHADLSGYVAASGGGFGYKLEIGCDDSRHNPPRRLLIRPKLASMS
jgi:hypothetical protein